jgi:hypothetical protein
LTSEKFKGIWPLPGGTTKYVDTLTRILRKIHDNNLTYDELLKWFISEYKLSGEKTPRGYLEYIRRFGFFKRIGERLSLTEEALKFLESGNYKMVYEVLNDAVLGLDDILSWLSEETLSQDEVHERLVKKYNLISWEKTVQTYFRLGWLRSLGYVDEKGRKYHLTDEGLKILGRAKEEKPKVPLPVLPTPINDYVEYATPLIKKHPVMSEFDTISTLVEPLLEALGWNTRDPDEVQRGHTIRVGGKTEYVDIALKVNNRPVMFVEAKSIDTDLRTDLAEQPIKYANMGGVNWCILTNGKEWRLYNAFWRIRGVEQKMFFELSINEFKENMEKLQLLSKGSMLSGKLDEEAELEHAKRMIFEWLRQEENSIVKDIMRLDPSLKEDHVRRTLRKIS